MKGVYTLCMYLHSDCLLWAYWWRRRQKKTPQFPPHQILAHHQNLWERVTWKSVWAKHTVYTRKKIKRAVSQEYTQAEMSRHICKTNATTESIEYSLTSR